MSLLNFLPLLTMLTLILLSFPLPPAEAPLPARLPAPTIPLPATPQEEKAEPSFVRVQGKKIERVPTFIPY